MLAPVWNNICTALSPSEIAKSPVTSLFASVSWLTFAFLLVKHILRNNNPTLEYWDLDIGREQGRFLILVDLIDEQAYLLVARETSSFNHLIVLYST